MAGSDLAQEALDLKHVKLASRNIRFIILSSSLVCQQTSRLKDVPLFLGADVLHKCGKYALKNLGRLHSKYASEGLTAKLCFPTHCRIKGIRGTADTAWFYSIQGLFKVAFTFYSKEVLKMMLKTLQDLWMIYVEEPALFGDLTIQNLDNVNLTGDLCSVLEDAKESMHRQQDDSYSPNAVTDDRTCLDHDTQHLAMDSCSHQEYQVSEFPVLQTVNEADIINSETEPKVAKTNNVINNVDISSNITQTVQTTSTENRTRPDYEIEITSIVSKLLSEFREEPSLSIITSYIESFVELIINEKTNIIEQQSTSFPIKLIKDYMESKKDKEQSGAPHSHELALHIVASWVGEMFYLFKGLIKHNVDTFKQTYINAITELPSPGEIVKMIYPSAMYNLVHLWLRGPVDDMHHESEQIVEANRLASLCLLILELLNGHPISGLGHWVYSYL